MDKTIKAFKTINPDFVANYKTARIILDPAKNKTGIAVEVIDAETGEPLALATIDIVELGLNKQTDAKGKSTIAPIKNGTYSVKCSKPDYNSETQTGLLVKQGQTLTIKFALKKV